MPLPREEVVAGLDAQLGEFESLVRSLSDEQWETPTRCDGWTIRDIASHVAGTMTEVVEGRAGDLAAPDAIDRLVAARRDRSPQEVADELAKARDIARPMMQSLDDRTWAAPAPGGVASSIGVGVEALWYDAFVHELDIRHALGMPERLDDGLKASVVHVSDILAGEGWGPATLALDGLDEVTINGGGRRVEGDPLAFVLAATGRGDPSVLALDETVNVYRPR
ncbi:MAG TPA: maleylpyruvate isomerase family mycothiol-dependent enzyme [Actinomycetota bacterium]|nr:maleylpyruvate isomerase family mycothiol-dependent enzyme [Actinomycetota bacterium]